MNTSVGNVDCGIKLKRIKKKNPKAKKKPSVCSTTSARNEYEHEKQKRKKNIKTFDRVDFELFINMYMCFKAVASA